MLLRILLNDDVRSLDLVKMLSTIANRKRLLILKIISEKEMSVGDIAYQIDLSAAATSQHLTKLREGKLVKARRQAQTIYYSPNSNGPKEILEFLEKILSSSQA